MHGEVEGSDGMVGTCGTFGATGCGRLDGMMVEEWCKSKMAMEGGRAQGFSILVLEFFQPP